MVFDFLIFRFYLTFLQAVLVILKHAMFLRHSIKAESALNLAGSAYQQADIDLKIQGFLNASSSERSVEEVASFIMTTEIGMFIVAFIILISH